LQVWFYEEMAEFVDGLSQLDIVLAHRVVHVSLQWEWNSQAL
jgi:hypothetical protein